LEFLTDVQELHGASAIDALFERREERLERKYKERMSAARTPDAEDALEAKVEELASIQQERGYMAEWRKEADGSEARFYLTEHNCPIHEVAHGFNQACSSELSLFRKVLDAEVEQLECKAKG